jgi:hypothetical protein
MLSCCGCNCIRIELARCAVLGGHRRCSCALLASMQPLPCCYLTPSLIVLLPFNQHSQKHHQTWYTAKCLS